ncbi:MAG: DJ-1/PfpI family protein, partial [Gemmatimonadetes bacterium]|nr:DJ-1/PfpI family protein [Gemmatimonadota bacterium]
MESHRPFVIGIPLYPGVDLLDVAAPYEIFSWMADQCKATRTFEVHTLAGTLDPVPTRDRLSLVPQRCFDEVRHLDLLWVPGGDPDAL